MKLVLLYCDDGDDDETDMIINTDTIYYVSQTGSDSNNGRSVATAFATLDHAMTVIGSLVVTPNVTVTVQLVDGVIPVATEIVPPAIGGNLIIQGNASDITAVTLHVSVPNAISIKGNQRTTWKNFTFTASAASVSGFELWGTSLTHLGSIKWSTNMTGDLITMREASTLVHDANFEIATQASRYLSIQGECEMDMNNLTVTLTGTPNWANQFITLFKGYARIESTTFSGSATGTRYFVAQSGVINTNGAGASYLPGNVAGSTATQGQYL